MPRIESEAARKIGGRIRDLREAAQFTQRDLEYVSGIDVSNIGKYERGLAMPSVPNVVRLAYALGVDPGQLIRDIQVEELPPRPETAIERREARAHKGVA